MAVAALPAHENIVGQYRAWQQNGHFNIQMELCEGGSLAQLLSQVRIVAFALGATPGGVEMTPVNQLALISRACSITTGSAVAVAVTLQDRFRVDT